MLDKFRCSRFAEWTWQHIVFPLITTPDPRHANIGGGIVRKGKLSRALDKLFIG